MRPGCEHQFPATVTNFTAHVALSAGETASPSVASPCSIHNSTVHVPPTTVVDQLRRGALGPVHLH